MSVHTPTPWGIERTDKNNWIGPMRRDGIKVAEIVTSIDRDGLKKEHLAENDANAELIVRAVNNHDALVEALEIEEQWISNLIGDCKANRSLNPGLIAENLTARREKIRKALKAAKEER